MKNKKSATEPETYTVIVWEQIPEELDVYVVPNSTLLVQERELLAHAHMKYGNMVGLSPDAEIALMALLAAFCEKAEHLPDEHPEGSTWALRFVKYKQEALEVDNKIITAIIQTGWIL